MHKCSKCGQEFEGKFCPECGTKYVDPDLCPKCGARHAKGAKFCEECGTRLDGKVVCPNCGAEMKEGASFCGECGTRLKGSRPQKSGGSTAVKVKSVVAVSGVICIMLAALMGLVFTFVSGVTATVEVSGVKASETNMLYYYFGDVYKDVESMSEAMYATFGWKNMGGAREFALYFPAALGTAIAAVGILGVVALCALTVFKVYKRYYKKQECNVVAPAVGVYLAFATLATLLLILTATESGDSKVCFSAPTLAGLITGGVLLGLGVLLLTCSNYQAFKGFNATVGGIFAVAVCALTVVVVAVLALPAGGATVTTTIDLGTFYQQTITTKSSVGLFAGLQAMLLTVGEDEKIFKLLSYSIVGGVMAVALAVVSAVTLFRKIPAVCEGKNKSNIILCAVAVVLSALYLAFTILFVDEMTADSEAEITKNFAVPITLLVMTVLALAAEVAGRLVHRKTAATEAAEIYAQAE